MEYDIAIIGSGPAGMEAAITAKIRNKNIIFLSSNNSSEKVGKAHLFENYLGLPNISGDDLNEAFLEHLKSLDIEIIPAKVTNIYDMGDYFNIQAETEIYVAKSVILATGVNFGRPYENENKFLGRGVSYCATCDGNLYKNKNIAVIGASPKEEKEANYLAELASSIIYIPLYKDVINLSSKIEVVREIPTSIEGNIKVSKLKTDKSEYEVEGIFILRDAISPKNLVPGLVTDEDRVVVDRNMATNIKGLFACGDIVGRPYQAIKAAGEGNIAALSAVEFIDESKK